MNIDLNSRYYRVANHLFVLHLASGIIPDVYLSAYAPFRVDKGSEAIQPSPLFTLTATTDDSHFPEITALITSFGDEDGNTELFRTLDGGMIFHFSLPGRDVCCKLYTDSDYRHATVCLDGEPFERLYGLTNSLMMLYAFATASLDTLLMHASVIENAHQGYLFLGKSGTGKSTHSRLWLEHVKGSTLLNDDNPVVRIINGRAQVYGSPWSGKTPCYRNRQIPLKAIVRLWQAPYNDIALQPLSFAYASVLPTCSCMKWDSGMAAGIHRTIEKLITSTPVYRLECLPDQAAAILCANTVRMMEKETMAHGNSDRRTIR